MLPRSSNPSFKDTPDSFYVISWTKDILWVITCFINITKEWIYSLVWRETISTPQYFNTRCQHRSTPGVDTGCWTATGCWKHISRIFKSTIEYKFSYKSPNFSRSWKIQDSFGTWVSIDIWNRDYDELFTHIIHLCFI